MSPPRRRWLLILAVVLLVTGCLSTVNAFDFFDLFRGGAQGGGRRSEKEGSNEAGGRCEQYLCNFSMGPCVANPEDCPCREPEYRCVHGPSYAYSCVASKEACDNLLRVL